MERTKSPVDVYTHFGIRLKHERDNSVGECPFCSSGKLFVANKGAKNGLHHCKVCGQEGNVYSFIKALHKFSANHTKLRDYEQLSENRKVSVAALKALRIVKSTITEEWLLPAYNLEGKMCNLYRWAEFADKRRLISAPTMQHHILGQHLYDASKPNVILVEGPWDAAALIDQLGKYVRRGKTWVKTTTNCEIKHTNVLATPGCQNYRELWNPLFEGKKVMIVFDNDHPKKNKKTGGVIPSPAWKGTERTVKLMLQSQQPEQIEVLRWGPKGYDPKLVDKFDIRDALSQDVKSGLELIYNRLVFPPEKWVEEMSAVKPNPHKLKPMRCTSFNELRREWKKAFHWTSALDSGLACVLACSASTRLKGDQLFLRLMGPPGTAKTTLCEAVCVSELCTVPISVTTGLHSGVRRRKDSKSKDFIDEIRDKMVVFKDGDTLLTAPNLSQILSDIRDIYDGATRARYKNSETKEHLGQRTPFLIAGTRTLLQLNRSFLGDRFLDCHIHRKGLNKEAEDEIVTSAIQSQIDTMRSDHKGIMDPKLVIPYRKTGGYAEYLREVIHKEICDISVPTGCMQYWKSLGIMVSYMRARPDKNAEEEDSSEVELATRLGKQFTRLAMCLTVVLNLKSANDARVNRILNCVATDTSHGLSKKICQMMFHKHNKGLGIKQLAIGCGVSETKMREHLRFLREIQAIRGASAPNNSGTRGRNRFMFFLSEELFSALSEIQSHI